MDRADAKRKRYLLLDGAVGPNHRTNAPRVKLYHSLFGLPHDLFKEIVSKL